MGGSLHGEIFQWDFMWDFGGFFHGVGGVISRHYLKSDQKLNEKNKYFLLKATLKLKTNRNYFVDEGDCLPFNTLFGCVKVKICVPIP